LLKVDLRENIIMNGWDFNNCRAFLEYMIQENTENSELIKAYVRLIEKKSEFDIAVSSHNADIQKNWENSQKEQTKNWQDTQAEVTKESIKSNYNLNNI
jgi:molecular chaperone DnaK (HSP70)